MNNFKTWIDDAEVAPGTNVQSAETFESDSQRESGFEAGTASSAIRVNTALRQANLVAAALMGVVDDENLDLTSSVDDVQQGIEDHLSGLTVSKSNSATEAQYASSDHGKGTIEERLTNLGFKEGVLTNIPSGSTSYVKQLGKMVLGHLDLNYQGSISNGQSIATLPSEFLRPSQNEYFYLSVGNKGSLPSVVINYTSDGTQYVLRGTFCGRIKLNFSFSTFRAVGLEGIVLEPDPNFSTLYRYSNITSLFDEGLVNTFSVSVVRDATLDFAYKVD